jgi:hypothetical protein
MALDRTVLTLAVTAALAAGIATRRPADGLTGMAPEALWISKYEWPAAYDVVIAGDSRVAEGVAPGRVEAGLEASGRPGVRVANFGFGHTGFDAGYLAATRSKLAPDARDPTIVLGVTPLSLTVHARLAGYSDWHRIDAMLPHQRWAEARLAPFTHPFRPIGTRRLRDAWKGREEESLRVFHADGWMASAPKPEEPRSAADSYPRFFDANPVDPAMVAALRASVVAWRAEGIRVVLLRVPIPAWMRELEEGLSGLDYATFAADLQVAGAEVLRLPDGYHSYDGAHLRMDAAETFSFDMGRALAEADRGAPRSPRE